MSVLNSLKKTLKEIYFNMNGTFNTRDIYNQLNELNFIKVKKIK